jgi:ABC-2 type transport system ATP-binding protein
VSRLRAVLHPADTGRSVQLATGGGGYMLRADPLCIDAHRFRALVEQARRCAKNADRLSLLRRAMTLWHGAALADAGPLDTVDRLTRGLAEERLAAEEERVDAELHTGNHLGVLGTLVELVAQHPYRQRLVAQLMLAQYRAGLIADALATYRAAREAMVSGIGLDPGRQLRELEGAILRGDPRLDVPAMTW